MPGLLESFLIPLATGAIAGALINWILEKSRAKERRAKILSALYAQVLSLPRINLHNQTATNKESPPLHLLPIQYPTVPFETALFSDDGISVSDKTVEAATDYLLKAKELNACVEALQAVHLANQHANIKAPTQTFLFDQAKAEMPRIIETLKLCLHNESKGIKS